MLSIPVIGTWTHWVLFGGEFPGTEIIPRLYIVHILLIPGILLALIAVHVGLVWYQKHTQFPGARPHRDATSSACGSCRCSRPRAARSSPSPSASSAIMGGLFQINPIWNFGPVQPAHISAGSQPDWYMGWSPTGMLRIFPPWEIYLGDYNDPAGVLGQPGVPAGALRARRRPTRGSRRGSPRTTRCTTCCSGRATCRCAPSLGVMAIIVLHGAAALRRQRHDRLLLRHLAQRHHLGRAGSGCWSCRRSPTGSPTGSASACSAPTARCSSTASRPASSSGCRTASSSRCTSRWPASTTTATRSRWSTRAPRCPRR